jgi:hypothetical protein
MRFPSAKTAITALLIVLWAAVIALNWPGHFSTDSVIQLLEGRTGHYETWHPPAMSRLLGIADWVLPGGGLFAAFDATLLFGSLLLLVRLRAHASWLAVPVLLACALTPQFLLYPGLVWKDVLFAHVSIAGFACLAFAAGQWERRNLRVLFVALALVFLSLAALIRQNGIVVSLVGAFALYFVARAHTGYAPAYAVAFFAAMLVTVAAAMFALISNADGGKGRVDEIKMLQLYDLVGAASLDPALSLAALHRADPAFERLIRKDGARLFTPERVDTLQRSRGLESARDAASPVLMAAQWGDLIVHRPFLYLKVRAAIFRWTFLTPDSDRCVPFVVGVAGPERILRLLKIKPRYDARDAALETYSQRFVGTPVFSHGFFAILAIAIAAVLFRRRAPADLAIAWLLAGAGMFTLTFFAVSLACDYRYLYLLDVAAMTAAFQAALGSQSRFRRSTDDTSRNASHAPAA